MVSDIRINFKQETVDEETILNLHRFGNSISQSIRSGFLPTETQIAIATVFSQYPCFDFKPVYPLGPDGTIEEMLGFKLDPVQDNSWDFFVSFHATCTRAMKDSIILQLLATSYIESLKDGNF